MPTKKTILRGDIDKDKNNKYINNRFICTKLNF